MSEYNINKGVGKPVEFQGLQAQYIFYLFGGLLGNFIIFAILYMTGVPPLIGIVYFIGSTLYLLYFVFASGKKYGEFGLAKLQARQVQPKKITFRNPRLFKDLKQKS